MRHRDSVVTRLTVTAITRYGDDAGNTVEENSRFFFPILSNWQLINDLLYLVPLGGYVGRTCDGLLLSDDARQRYVRKRLNRSRYTRDSAT